MHFEQLIKIISNNNGRAPFVCIEDIVRNGFSKERFAVGSSRPMRHEFALFLAGWCKYSGLDATVYRDWLIAYCVDVLSEISSSSASQIRHSTKSTIKYIHRSDVPFVCNCEKNIFKAHCSSLCPIYKEMKDVYMKNIEAEKETVKENNRVRKPVAPMPKPQAPPSYKKQFDEAVFFLKQYLVKGCKQKDIAILLNEKGYKTTRGKDWTPSTVSYVATQKGLASTRKRRS